MQDSRHPLDELFSVKLEQFEIEPPAEVWARLEKNLEKKKKKRIFVWMIRTGLAASLVLVLATGWYLTMQKHAATENNEQITQNQSINQNNTPPKQIVNREPVMDEQPTHDRNVVASMPSPHATQKHSSLISQCSPPENSFAEAELSIVRSQASEELSPLKSLVAAIPSGHSVMAQLTVFPSDDVVLTESDRAIIASNIEQQRAKEQHTPQGQRWSVGAALSPSQQYDEILAFNNSGLDAAVVDPSETLNQPSVNQGYDLNLDGGLNVSYQVSKRLALQSGVNYNTISQNSSQIPVSFAGHNWISNRNDYTYQSEVSNTVNTGTTNNNPSAINTLLGIANLTLPAGTELVLLNNKTSEYSEWAENYQFAQQAGYVEIPFTARYQLLGNRLALHVLGGISANILVSNQAYLLNGQEILARGQVEDLSLFTLSSSMGMGLNYGLSQRFNLSVEPVLKMMLNDLNRDADFVAKPYTFGIYTGISYRF